MLWRNPFFYRISQGTQFLFFIKNYGLKFKNDELEQLRNGN